MVLLDGLAVHGHLDVGRPAHGGSLAARTANHAPDSPSTPLMQSLNGPNESVQLLRRRHGGGDLERASASAERLVGQGLGM